MNLSLSGKVIFRATPISRTFQYSPRPLVLAKSFDFYVQSVRPPELHGTGDLERVLCCSGVGVCGGAEPGLRKSLLLYFLMLLSLVYTGALRARTIYGAPSRSSTLFSVLSGRYRLRPINKSERGNNVQACTCGTRLRHPRDKTAAAGAAPSVSGRHGPDGFSGFALGLVLPANQPLPKQEEAAPEILSAVKNALVPRATSCLPASRVSILQHQPPLKGEEKKSERSDILGDTM